MEYFLIVHRHLGPRYVDDADHGARLGRAGRRLRRLGFLLAYLGVVLGLLALLRRHGNTAVYTVVVLTRGGMHVLYDGFIWKRPAPGRDGMLTPVAD